MGKIFIDLDLSLELDSSNLKFTDPSTDHTVIYEEYLNFSETDKSKYVIDCVQDLVRNSIVLELYKFDITSE